MKIVSAIQHHSAFGRTIVVNILGEIKVCNFDCVYCSLGPSQIRISRLKQDVTFPSIEEVLTEVGRALGQAAQAGESIDTILISGNGEPTLHPLFPQFTKELIKRRSELASSTNIFGAKGFLATKITCLTNGDSMSDRNIHDALNLYDECIVKIDVGTEKAFKKINRPLSRSNLEKVILGARTLQNLSIQSTVTASELSLTHSDQLDEWIEVIAMLNPKKIYLQRAQSPCADPGLTFASEDEVLRVSHWLERRLKIKAQVELGFVA